MARIGLPKKYAKMGFAKGWRAFKAAKRKFKKKSNPTKTVTARQSNPAKRLTVKKSNPKKNSPRKGNPMAKKQKYKIRWRTNPMVKEFTDGAVNAGTAVGGSMVMNMIPAVQNLNPWIRGLMLAVPGAAMVAMSKDQMFKSAGKGMITGGMITMLLPWLPKEQKVFGRALTNAERAMIQRSLGVPIKITKNNSMNVPIELSRNNMGASNYNDMEYSPYKSDY